MRHGLTRCGWALEWAWLFAENMARSTRLDMLITNIYTFQIKNIYTLATKNICTLWGRKFKNIWLPIYIDSASDPDLESASDPDLEYTRTYFIDRVCFIGSEIIYFMGFCLASDPDQEYLSDKSSTYSTLLYSYSTSMGLYPSTSI